MKHFRLLAASGLALATTLAAGSIASAHDSGVYLRGNGGVGVISQSDLTGGINSQVHGDGVSGSSDVALSLGLGYAFDNNWRLELDGNSLYNDLGTISGVPNTFAKLRQDSLMLNAIYDFDGLGALVPYIGAGVGLVRGDGSFSAHDFAVGGNFGSNPVCAGAPVAGQAFSCDVQDKNTNFGFQLLAGLGVALSDNLTWDTHYKYQDAGSFDFDGVRTGIPGGGTSNFATTFEDAASHAILTGLRYQFGHDHAPRAVAVVPTPPPVQRTFTCWDGNIVTDRALCTPQPAPEPIPEPVVIPTYSCWDNSVVNDLALCPAQPVAQSFLCADNATVVSDLSQCPVVQSTNLNVCTNSPVKIFDVPASTQFKQVPRLGTMPEFGDSHALSPTEFYAKLDSRYNSNATDKAYLNYLFRSMGYAGWRDARPDMFSNDVLPVGTRGILGLGEQHHFEYKILPTSDRDRQAFRIQSANGSVVHFMKTCGNYFYGCE